ncbi:uncharacterized protein LOC127838535 isoform X2 [Dreissena polymorpha]|uniref:uncharacterized protein LOC127838535 isoform X2 n=1 Tax=Dreissena polymorpha TaxID=45954 RepID=UPI0022642020|nr:uncharacterized protein LOC127838535 isoform X2 [Dreissena polymorpha]
MNELITDRGLRNWIKACLGLKCVRDGMLPFMERKCEDMYANNETFTKSITKLTTYLCSVCCVKDVKPNHSMKNCPAKRQLGGKTKCACTNKKKQLCPHGGACGVMYDRIMNDHVNMAPRWDNSDCQKWYLNGWEQMKCFIEIPGYKEKAHISQADVTAFVHICQNNKTLYTIFKSHLGKLMQVRSDRNEIYHSGDLDLTDDKLKEYLANMKAVLNIAVFNAFTSDIQEQLDKLAKLEADVGIEVDTETEIEARKEALNALIEDTSTLEERIANTPADEPELSIQQAQFAVLQDSHMRSIADRLKGIKDEFNLCAKFLLEQSTELKSITAGVHVNTKAFEALQKELVQQSELIRGIEVATVKTNLVVTKSYKTLKDVECDVKTILLIFKEIFKHNRPHVRNINGSIVAEIKGTSDEKQLSNEIVQAFRNRKLTPDQEANGDFNNVVMDVIKAVEADGNDIIDVRTGSIIINILCPSLTNWITLCEKCIDGRMTRRFKPLQDYLRKNTSFGNLTITVDMLETDFVESVDTIVKQLYPHLIAALPQNMHRPDGIENTNVQQMNAMLTCLLDNSYQYSHQKHIADIQIHRAHRIQCPETQIDNGQTTWVRVDQICTGSKTDQNETPPTSETLSVQNTFSGTHTDLNVKEDAISTDLEACGRKIYDVTQPKIKQSNHDERYQVTSRNSDGSISIASFRESLMFRPRNSEHLYRSIGTNTAVTSRSSTDPELRKESWAFGSPHMMPDMSLEREDTPRRGLKRDRAYNKPFSTSSMSVFEESLHKGLKALESDDVTQPKIRQSNDDMPYQVRKRHSDGSLVPPGFVAIHPPPSLPLYRPSRTDTEVTCSSSTSPTGSWNSGFSATQSFEEWQKMNMDAGLRTIAML